MAIAFVVATVVAVVVAVVVVSRSALPGSSGAPEPASPATPMSRRPLPPLPNDGWIIPAPAGMTMRANEVIDDQGMLPLYLDEEQAEAIADSGFRLVRMRSYYADASGGGAFKVIDVNDPAGLLRRLRRVGPGRGEPYPDLPEAQIRSQVVQMESTRAHDVFAHFRTITFLSDPYVVEIEAYAISGDEAQRRADAYAAAQHELLQSR